MEFEIFFGNVKQKKLDKEDDIVGAEFLRSLNLIESITSVR